MKNATRYCSLIGVLGPVLVLSACTGTSRHGDLPSNEDPLQAVRSAEDRREEARWGNTVTDVYASYNRREKWAGTAIAQSKRDLICLQMARRTDHFLHRNTDLEVVAFPLASKNDLQLLIEGRLSEVPMSGDTRGMEVLAAWCEILASAADTDQYWQELGVGSDLAAIYNRQPLDNIPEATTSYMRWARLQEPNAALSAWTMALALVRSYRPENVDRTLLKPLYYSASNGTIRLKPSGETLLDYVVEHPIPTVLPPLDTFRTHGCEKVVMDSIQKHYGPISWEQFETKVRSQRSSSTTSPAGLPARPAVFDRGPEDVNQKKPTTTP